MFLYPFKTVWLKTPADRHKMADAIMQQTYLSDADYRKRDHFTKFFYGLVNENEFVLENIGNKNIPKFFEGDILGVGDETYVKLRMGALKHTRMYVVYMVLLLTGLFFWFRAVLGIDTVDSRIIYIFSAILVLLLGYSFYFIRQFQHSVSSGVDFFRGLFEADTIAPATVPAIFKR